MRASADERRYLITIGSPDCPNLPRLLRVEKDIKLIADFFTSDAQQYEHVLKAEISLSASASQIRQELIGWFADPDRREADRVVIYVAGHGDATARFGDHCLLTSDSDPRRSDSYIRTSDLARWLYEGAGFRPQSILLILDVCYAGGGAADVTKELHPAHARVLRDGAGFWVMATSDPNSEAADGAFVNAFLNVTGDDAWFPAGGARYISPADLTEAVNEHFRKHATVQEAVYYVMGGGRQRASFIRNPNFTSDFEGLSFEDRTHWELKARGIDFHGASGWYFTGRKDAIKKLVNWLTAPKSDLRARVVTGAPGSGKSAVLSWLIMATHRATRDAMIEAGLIDTDLRAPPLDAVVAKVNVRGMRVGQIVAALAQAFDADQGELSDLIADLSCRDGPIGIVIDSLDEAAEPTTIERDLLDPLRGCNSVRLIVGSRRQGRSIPLRDFAECIDLDSSEYFEQRDVVAFAYRRLTAPNATYASTDQHVHAHHLADLVATRAARSYLLARLICRSLAEAPPIDTSIANWAESFDLPVGIEDAFASDLARFPPEKRREIVDLLIPLAYSRGKGLPQKGVWHRIASAVSDRQYTNADLRLLKEEVGYYLIQDTESDEVVYRLFHQTFADYLRRLTAEEDVERRFAEGLAALVPREKGALSWDQVREPYLQNHLPSHAAVAGILESYVLDLEFLLNISPMALLAELPGLRSPDAKAAGYAFRRASHWMRAGQASRALSYLAWGACQYRSEALERQLRQRVSTLPWSPEWSISQQIPSSYVLADIGESTTAIAVGIDPQHGPIVILGTQSGALVVIDPTTSREIGRFVPERLAVDFRGTTPRVNRIIHLVLGLEGVVVASWSDGSIGVIDSVGLTKLGWYSSDNDPLAMCTVPADGETLLAASYTDLRLQLWRLPTLDAAAERKESTRSKAYAIAATEFDGVPAVVTGVDSFNEGRNTETNLLRIWRARDLAPLWISPDADGGCIVGLLVCRIANTDWILTRDLYGHSVAVDPHRGTYASLGETLSDILGVIPHDRGILVIGLRGTRLTRIALTPNDSEGRSVDVQEMPSQVDLPHGHVSEILVLSGRKVVVTESHQKVRVWDLEELFNTDVAAIPSRVSDSFRTSKTALTAIGSHEGKVFCGNGDGDLWCWDVEGTAIWHQRWQDNRIVKIAGYTDSGDSLLAVAIAGGLLQMMNAETGQARGTPIKIGEEVLDVSIHWVSDRPTALLVVNLEPQGRPGHYVVRPFDLRSGVELPRPKQSVLAEDYLELAGYYRTKLLCCVAALDVSGETLIAFAGPNGEVRAMSLQSYEELDVWGESSVYVKALAATSFLDAAILIAGDDSGALFLRDLSQKHLRAVQPRAHNGALVALLFVSAGNDLFIVSGSTDGMIIVWDINLVAVETIDVGKPIQSMTLAGPNQLAIATDRTVDLLRISWLSLGK